MVKTSNQGVEKTWIKLAQNLAVRQWEQSQKQLSKQFKVWL